MLLVLALLSALDSSSSATTAIPDAGTADVPLRVFGRQLPECIDPTHDRSTQEIVWSCLATIFACTWVAVHPNLPGPYDSKLAQFKRQLLTMIYATIAPEAMMAWAIKQWGAAKRIANEFNKANGREGLENNTCKELPWYSLRRLNEWLRGAGKYPSKRWTRTHGFFVQMGGFMLFEGDTPIRVLGSKDLQEMIDKGAVDAPEIREHEIWDRSKGDFLTKLFVVLQTTWFVVQCLARWASHLAVTELEVVTLGFAILNAITYWFWWDKPQNVLVAVTVPFKAGPNVVNSEGEEEQDRLRAGKESWAVRKVRKELDQNPWTAWWAVPFRLVQAIVRILGKMTSGEDYDISRGSLRVPMFYAERSIDLEVRLVLVLAPLFGALHLIPWSASFPSTAERWLWCSSALIITIEPLLAVITATTDDGSSWLSKALYAMTIVPAMLGLPLYILARLMLFSLAFTTLRHLPPAALTAINWMSFVPHI